MEITQDKVDFLREALYRHVQQVNSYFVAAENRIAGYDGDLQQRHKDEFTVRAKLLIAQLEQLIICAGRVRKLSNHMNIEQLEAMVDRLNADIERIAA